MKIIDIAYNSQDSQKTGWTYLIEGCESGRLDERASDAIDRICENMEAFAGDYAEIISAVGAEPGDQLWLGLDGMSRDLDLAALLGLDG